VKNYSVKLSKCTIGGLLIYIFSLSANATGSVKQNENHDHTDITQAAKQFLSQNIDTKQYSRTEIEMGKLDSRLKLAHCNSSLLTSLAPGSKFSGKTTVHVKCNSEAKWTIYINANINLYTHVIHTAEPLAKGHILSKTDLVSSEINLNRVRYGYFTNTDSLIGKQLKRRLSQNKIIRVNYVKAQTLVKRGEIVNIVAENSGYSVKMSGTAMSNGAKGDRVQVKNLSSHRIIEGTVTETGVISIN
jgi:flagellar basal body P-ring formation protein FlgA